MTEQTKRAELWNEVELIGAQWQASLQTDYPLIPLNALLPLWNSAVTTGMSAFDRMRLESQGHEVLLLKTEVQRLRRELARVTGEVRFPEGTDRRRAS